MQQNSQKNLNNSNSSSGSLQKAMNGEFDFDVKQVLSEGWELTQKDKSSMLQGVAFIIIVSFMVLAVAQSISEQKGIDFYDPNFRLGYELVWMILIAPFAAGLLMMGVNASIGGKNTIAHLFYFINRTFSIIITSILTTALVQIGFLLLFLPGLYLLVATRFAIPLVLDKGILPARAVFMSIKAVNFQWLKFVQLYVVFLGLAALVIFTFGIALIWVAPFYYNVKGLLYRDIFGVGNEHKVLYPIEESDSREHNGNTEAIDNDTTSSTVDEKHGSKSVNDSEASEESRESNSKERKDRNEGYFDA